MVYRQLSVDLFQKYTWRCPLKMEIPLVHKIWSTGVDSYDVLHLTMDMPLCIDWSDDSALKEHEYTVTKMTAVWDLYERDIDGWEKLRDRAEEAGNIEAMREFAMRATHSRWVRKVLMARLKFRRCGHDPYPNVAIWSFAMPKSGCDE
jgi:hypothetical protein